VGIELLIGAIKALVILILVLNLTGVMLWFERKGAALIQDRIGANRAAIFGIGRKLGLPNFGIVNTLLADPIKLFTKEDFVPEGADRFIHSLAPFLALFPVLITFIVVPIGDVLRIGSRSINLQGTDLNVGALYVLAVLGLGVYGVALGGWARTLPGPPPQLKITAQDTGGGLASLMAISTTITVFENIS